MPRQRAWVKYTENKYHTALREHHCDVNLENLTATQTEIEQIKYEMVRHEAFRAGEPILVFKGRYGGYYVVDGHTRARVLWDTGKKTVPAILYTSPDAEVCAEQERIAIAVGGDREKRVWEIPIVDRVGKGSDAWKQRRQELLEGWKAESEAAQEGPTQG